MALRIAFAGLRHGHIFQLYRMVQEHPLYEITGAFEEDPAAKKAAMEQGVSCFYDSFEALLSDPAVDAVALGGYYGQRGQMAIAALNAGKHVIADKPLCTDLSELEQIRQLSQKRNLTVSCMFTMRYEPKIQAVKALAESGALGEFNNVSFGGQHPLQYGRRPQWYFEEGKHGGVINDIAIHGIDVLSYALGLTVDEVLAARCWNKYAAQEPRFADSAQFMLKASNNAGIVADVSYAIPDGVEFALPYYWQFYIWGTKGTIGFSLNEEVSYYYASGDETPHVLKETPCTDDYLTDFYHLLQGNSTVILPQEDVFAATKTTLKIQQSSI